MNLKYTSHNKDSITEEKIRKILQFIKIMVPEYTNFYNNVLLVDLYGHKVYMNSPSISDEEYDISMKQFREKKNDMIDFKESATQQLKEFIPEGEELIDTYPPNESKICLDQVYKDIKEAETIIESWETDISEPQKQMPYLL